MGDIFGLNLSPPVRLKSPRIIIFVNGEDKENEMINLSNYIIEFIWVLYIRVTIKDGLFILIINNLETEFEYLIHVINQQSFLDTCKHHRQLLTNDHIW